MKFFRQLKNCELFDGLTDGDINKLFDAVEARIVKYSRGQLIAKEGEETREICVILDGNLLAYHAKSGKPEILRSMTDGDCYGMETAYSVAPSLGYNVAAALDSTVLYINGLSLLTVGRTDETLSEKVIKNLLRLLSDKISDLENNRGYITIKGMRKKIAKLIYDKYLEQGTLTVDLGMNRNEMAKFLNVSRPSMSREMMRMRDNDKMFDFRKGIIEIKDLEALRKVATEAE
ncbi:MAG: Crp/Fnr family transcriptional regulator [Clostridia bacterium]|nr:Crp/Fnr family transcriptional regulator [Clostridia bacterium]